MGYGNTALLYLCGPDGLVFDVRGIVTLTGEIIERWLEPCLIIDRELPLRRGKKK
jgi:hypothetical protein